MVNTIAEIYHIRNRWVMGINWDMVVARLSRRGPEGKLSSALTGEETDEELRCLIDRLAQECPVRVTQECALSPQPVRCPFCALRHLYHFSLQDLLNNLSRKTLLSLFELEWEVRNTAAAVAGPPAGGNFAVDVTAAG